MMPRQPFFRALVAFWIAVAAILSPTGDANAQTSYQGLWYRGEVETGWGVSVAQQGDILFVTWFTYDTDGTAMWLVGSNFTRTTGSTFTGTLYRTTGARFDDYTSAPFDFTAVGNGTLSFADANTGTFTYTVNGITQSKPIVRQVFSPTPPTCVLGGTPGQIHNFSDLWWAGQAENGWGVNITHQGDILFATWFTYDSTGRGMWIVGPRIERVGGASSFSGPLYRVTGPAFNANPWDPNQTETTQVGAGTFTFGTLNSATFTYTVDGVTQSKAITRQVFSTPVSVCITGSPPSPPPPPPPPPPTTPPPPVAPRVYATWPTNGVSGASAILPVTATFSVAMNPATINASTFTLAGPGGPVAASVSYSGVTATLTPNARLAAQTQYTATISTGARDASGIALASNHSFVFTTRSSDPPHDTVPPQVVATWPIHTGRQVSVVPPLSATFSEPMDPATINASTFVLTGPGGTVPATVTYSGITATLTPAARLVTETEYTATITAGARDLTGTPVAARSFTFTTLNYEPPPIVAGCPTPASNAQLRRLEWGTTPIVRLGSGVVASFRVAQSRLGRASVAYTQGQTAASPPQPTIDVTVSRCPGVIEENLHPVCRLRTTFFNFVTILAYNRPLTERGLTTQEQMASYGCLAPAAVEQHYVNVRWTFASCPIGPEMCGYSLQWGEAGTN